MLSEGEEPTDRQGQIKHKPWDQKKTGFKSATFSGQEL